MNEVHDCKEFSVVKFTGTEIGESFYEYIYSETKFPK